MKSSTPEVDARVPSHVHTRLYQTIFRKETDVPAIDDRCQRAGVVSTERTQGLETHINLHALRGLLCALNGRADLPEMILSGSKAVDMKPLGGTCRREKRSAQSSKIVDNCKLSERKTWRNHFK